MSIAFYIKNNLNKLPIGIQAGKLISYIPYTYRPGVYKSYRLAKKDISNFSSYNQKQKEEFIFNKIKTLVVHAYNNVNFYKDFYDSKGFDILELNSFEDINKIPIIRKDDLQKYSLEDRSYDIKGMIKSNTGGSTGKPLTFFTTPDAIGHEWAHIHNIWGVHGYTPTKLKLNFVGRSTVKNHVEYDLLRNSLAIDIYSSYEDVKENLYEYAINNKIEYLHGYPSAIYEFALKCEQDDEFRRLIKCNLKAAFLVSEFPYKYLREKIEDVFDIKTQSFFGHTERCIMAGEFDEEYQFQVMQTYGYAEIVGDELVGTSYLSYGTPLIRYNTEDKINVINYKDNILNTISIVEGRKNETVIDKNNKVIPLTGLIFGRHHILFDKVEYMQVYQNKPGEIIILYVDKKGLVLENEAKNHFDSQNINLDICFKKIKKPYKTQSGKIMLKINKL